jgi:hypothetical protein
VRLVPPILALAAALVLVSAAGTAPAPAPTFVRNIPTGQTGWFSSPALVDLNGDGKLEIVAPFYSTFVFDARGRKLGEGTATSGRVYAPAVAAYDFRAGTLVVRWRASTCSGGQCPEVRGLAAADLDGDGRIETVATTTNTSSTGSQVFVFEPNGKLRPGWPRYNRTSDPHFNGAGNAGYGAYGENVGIGNLDDDKQLEIVVTFDNHQINVFNADGSSLLASPWFTNRQSSFAGRRLGWGQMIRWLDPTVDADQYHLHVGPWPSPANQAWLQWTASPPDVADLDGDGRNEVVGLPNVERHIPYETQGYAFMALDGAYGNGARSARRHPGFEHPIVTPKPATRPDGDWYPPDGIPAPTLVDLTGDGRPDIVAAVPGGFVYAVSSDGKLLWRYDYAQGRPKIFASEVVAADLNRDGKPELVFGTYGPDVGDGRLVILAANGKLEHSIRLPHQQHDANGVGVAAAPSIGDLDGDGTLDIVLTTIDHGIDVFRVPGSDTKDLPWPTGRGSLLRSGTATG